MPSKITAAVLRICGEPPAVEDRPEPIAAPGDLAVAVTAAPITPLDLLCASGASYFGTPQTPYVPGVQGVGRLVDDGSPVWFATSAGMRPGDGSMAARVAVPPSDVVRLPADVPLPLIAALGLSAVAALQALRLGSRPPGAAPGSPSEGEFALPGAQVLILGAGGMVGQAGIQLARLGGASRVTAVARSARARARALELGADETVELRADDDPASLASRLGGPFDVVLDPVFGVSAAGALRVLRPGGRLVNLGSSAAATAPIDSATLRSGMLQVLGYTNNSLTPAERAAALTTIAAYAAAGSLTADHEVIPFASVTDGWSRQAAGTATGRIVLAL
ncbi:zinc-binding alcohol dehydrogenase family protein [Actinoplanes sp. NPDC051411]|uniref:quinone oxidoreductase family protein n=1 Tax=Actinoplanes sp. NPDC051411 TaxID=3155522 RepID=UPI003429FBA1